MPSPTIPLNFALPLTPESCFEVRAIATGGFVDYLPGWTVQCINTECSARGQWLRMDRLRSELCTNCGAPLHRVPPPLGPRLRMRPRSLGHYRPTPRAH